jgi:antitoxin (DNA-binding transcriptional repressor) of toxin-antitoxin stability system
MVSKGDNPDPRMFDLPPELRPLLDRARQQAEIILTSEGHPVARLTPMQSESSSEDFDDAVRTLDDIASRSTLGDLSWKDLRDEGRKW